MNVGHTGSESLLLSFKWVLPVIAFMMGAWSYRALFP